MIVVEPDAKLNESGRCQAARPESSSQAVPTEETTMRITRKLVIGAATAALIAGGAGIAAAGGGSDNGSSEGPDVAITGDALQKASDAALAAAGGGRVTASEVGDEESNYQVEVTRADGSKVDVQLDRNFAVVGQSADTADTADTQESNSGD
jgi:uncharacterized membrane protein YkoI